MILIEEKTSMSKPNASRITEAKRMRIPKEMVAAACIHLDNLHPTPCALYSLVKTYPVFYIVTMILLQ